MLIGGGAFLYLGVASCLAAQAVVAPDASVAALADHRRRRGCGSRGGASAGAATASATPCLAMRLRRHAHLQLLTIIKRHAPPD